MTLLSLFILSTILTTSFARKYYSNHEPVPITVQPLTPGGNSYDNKLYLYPVDYYNPTLDNCDPVSQTDPYNSEPEFSPIYKEDTFFGNHFYNGPFATAFNNKSTSCSFLCDRDYNKENVTMINDLIKKNYKLNFFIDDVPVGRELYDSQTKKYYIDNGVPMGFIDLDKIPHLYNHFKFVIYYVSYGLEYEILYSIVSTRSIQRNLVAPLDCQVTPPLLLRYSDYSYNGNRISYDIVWKEVHINKWAHKWDLYTNDIVQPFILNAVVVIFTILTVILAIYAYITITNAFNTEKLEVIYKSRQTMKFLNKEASNTEEPSPVTEGLGMDDLEFSWPSLAKDVFRLPDYAPFLYWLVANGLHFTWVFTAVIVLLAIGVLDTHSFEDEVSYVSLAIYLITSSFPALINCYFFKKFDSPSSKESFKKKLTLTTLLNSFAIPFIVLTLIYITNITYASVNAPTNISLPRFKRVAFYYISITLVSFFAGLKFIKVRPYSSSDIEKKIPVQPLTLRTTPSMIISGIFPFGVVLIPLSSTYITLWYSHFYSNPSLTISYVLLLVLTISISVLNVYHSLSVGNWKWQWYSLLTGYSVAAYTLLYSFYLTKFKFGDHASFVIFLLQSFTISNVVGLIGGSVSFVSSYLFIKSLYSGIAH